MRSMEFRISETPSLGDRRAVAILTHQRFGGMGQRLEARQAEEAARALDRVNQPEDIVENAGIIRVLLELHELNVDDVQAFMRFGQEFAEKIVHEPTPRPQARFWC